MEDLSQSPLPTKIEVKDAEVRESEVGGDFPWAMEMVLAERKVTRKDWEDKEAYGYLNDGFLMIKKTDDKKDYQWIVSEADMKAEDWIIV